MKKRLLKTILGILIFFCKPLGAQSYVPFPDSNAVWNVIDPESPTSNSVYSIGGDSVYNSHTYKKYFKTTDTTYLSTPILYALVRQDVPNKKVYGIKAGLASESLLYNFNLSINAYITIDLISKYLPGLPMPTRHLKVIDKDSMLVNSQYRKRVVLQNYSSLNPSPYTFDYWVEGIGSLNGVLNPGVICVETSDGPPAPTLLCFKQNSALAYQLPYTYRCIYVRSTIGINKLSSENADVRIYPNPSSGVINIELLANNSEAVEVTMIDVLGALKKKITLQQSSKIDISNLPGGIYFMQVFQKGQLLGFEKIMKD